MTWITYSETHIMDKIERDVKIATWTCIVITTLGVILNELFVAVSGLVLRRDAVVVVDGEDPSWPPSRVVRFPRTITN